VGVTPPLAIIQARLHSTRLPEKLLLDVRGHPLLWWGWAMAASLLGSENVVIACPADDVVEFQLALPDATIFGWPGLEEDVLGRLHACAHAYRSDPRSLLCRVTPDDFPIDLTREVLNLDFLDRFHEETTDATDREHVGRLFDRRVEVNTWRDVEAVRLKVSNARLWDEQSHER